jgi:DNA-binding transcriptional LysR family regulator
MEMHQLRYVTAVARTGNFSRAAEQCHVSQPSLSQHLDRAGLGLSLIPAMAAVARRDRPEYRPLQSPRPERKIVAVWPRQRPPGRAAGELLDVVTSGIVTTPLVNYRIRRHGRGGRIPDPAQRDEPGVLG